MVRGSGLNRRTLNKIPYYPEPLEIYKVLKNSDGWKYKTNQEYFKIRDKALIGLIYIIGLRVSEALRLKKSQFIFKETYIEVRAIELSKAIINFKKGKRRKELYREGFIALSGERVLFSSFIIDYLDICKGERLFNFKTKRAWQIFKAYFPEFTLHWFRAFCENYLYSNWDKDLLAVANYIKVEMATLEKYITKRYLNYPKI